jgi:predicted nucleotidyltransferase
MVARYESGVSSPTVGALRRLLRAAGHDLLLSSTPRADADGDAIGDLSGRTGSVLRQNRAAIHAAAGRLGARNVRVFGHAVRGGDVPGERAELLVDFPVAKRGLMPLLTLACHVEGLTGIQADVVTPEMLAPDASARALAQAVPL